MLLNLTPESWEAISKVMTPMLACMTLMNALAIGWVALEQYRLARARFKLDLFERRFAVYKATQKFLSTVVGAGPRFTTEELWEFRAETQNASFLFRNDVVQFLEGVDAVAVEVRTLAKTYERLPEGHETTRIEVLLKQLNDGSAQLPTLFGSYLSLNEWR